MAGGAIQPAPAVSTSTRISARLTRVQEHHSPVNVCGTVAQAPLQLLDGLGLWLGSWQTANNAPALCAARITHALALGCRGLLAPLEGSALGLSCMALELACADEDEDILSHLDGCVDFLRSALRAIIPLPLPQPTSYLDS